MKFFSLVCSIILNLSAFSQINVPVDRVFLQTDRNHYNIGDTIFFRAYVRNNLTGRFESQSLSLFCLLIDPVGKTCDSARFRIINSVISGWMTVPLDAKMGVYTIASFTSGMMNADPDFAFKSHVSIGYGISNNVKVSSANNHLQHDLSGYDLEFFPEGGNLINDEPQLIAVKAKFFNGETRSIEGEILNEEGNSITHFNTNAYGIGVFQLTPISRGNYYALAKESSEKKWPLTIHRDVGVSLNVINTFRELIYVRVFSQLEEKIECHLFLIQNYDTVISKAFELKNSYSTTIETGKLFPGMAHLILTDEHLQVIADRYVFVNHHKLIDFNFILTDNVREDKTLKISPKYESESKDTVMLSISVVDSSRGFDGNLIIPDIQTSMFFEADINKVLPENLRQNGLSNLDPKSVDQILLAYKPENEPVKLEKAVRDNNKIRISFPEGRIVPDVSCLIKQTAEIIKYKPVNNEVMINLDSIYPGMQELVILKTRKIKDFDSLEVDYQVKREYFNSLKKTILKDSILYQPISDTISVQYGQAAGGKIINLDAVIVKSKRKRLGIVDAEETFMHSNVHTLNSQHFSTCNTFEDIIFQQLHPYSWDHANKKIVLRYLASFINAPPPAIFVVDGTKIGDDYLMIADMPAANIESVSVLKGQLGYNMYGALNGIVFVTTKQGMGIYYRSKQNVNQPKIIPVFRSQNLSRNSSEKKFTVRNSGNPTLLWEDQVILNQGEMLSIKFPSKLPTGTYMIRINGVTSDYSTGSGTYFYRVK